jgi:hypothetical protein
MSSIPRHDPIAALNQVLSEVIDEVGGVKQARRTIPERHALHAELDQLLEDLKRWAQQLLELDETLGVSPLSVMPSVAGRKPTNLWPHGADDEEVRRVIHAHLDRLTEHVAAAEAEQETEESRALLTYMTGALLAHKEALNRAIDPR